MKKVIVGMSGGVDSSVAAGILVEKGYDVSGVTMCLGVSDKNSEYGKKCCDAKSIEDAKVVCRKLGIKHYVLDFSKELETDIISNFITEYKLGHTPNPCVRCNRFLKFGKLLEKILAMGYDYIATGHYAGITKKNGNYYLSKSYDSKKDQTYFMYGINKKYLGNIIFPLNDITKDKVRKIAKSLGLHVANKPQSQDICFVSGKNYKQFIKSRIGDFKSGNIVDTSGEILGTHTGIINYTVGQRKGIGIAAPNPLYVIKIDAENNQIIVGNKDYLKIEKIMAEDINILVDEFPEKCTCKTRFRSKEVDCKVKIKNNTAEITFKPPHNAVSIGQSIVFYSGNIVLGGGIIKETWKYPDLNAY